MAQALLQRASLLAPDLIPLNYLIAATPESMLLQLVAFRTPWWQKAHSGVGTSPSFVPSRYLVLFFTTPTNAAAATTMEPRRPTNGGKYGCHQWLAQMRLPSRLPKYIPAMLTTSEASPLTAEVWGWSAGRVAVRLFGWLRR